MITLFHHKCYNSYQMIQLTDVYCALFRYILRPVSYRVHHDLESNAYPDLRLSNERQRQAWLENEVKVLNQRVQKTDEVLAAASSLGEQIAAKNQVGIIFTWMITKTFSWRLNIFWKPFEPFVNAIHIVVICQNIFEFWSGTKQQITNIVIILLTCDSKLINLNGLTNEW